MIPVSPFGAIQKWHKDDGQKHFYALHLYAMPREKESWASSLSPPFSTDSSPSWLTNFPLAKHGIIYIIKTCHCSNESPLNQENAAGVLVFAGRAFESWI